MIDRSHLKEHFEAPENRLSFMSELIKAGAFDYGFVCDALNHFHIDVIRNQLTQNIAAYMPAILDELNAALADELDHLVTKGRRLEVFVDNRLYAHYFIPKDCEKLRKDWQQNICRITHLFCSLLLALTL